MAVNRKDDAFVAVNAAMGIEENDVIDGIGRGQPPRAVAAGAEAVGCAPATKPAGAAVFAVQGAAASSLGGIVRDLSAGPPFDDAKVERLRAAITGGDYRADPEAIATAMLALESVPPFG